MIVEMIAGVAISLFTGGLRLVLGKTPERPVEEWDPIDPDAQIPRVTESAPIPVVFGTKLIANPNVIHVGAFSAAVERQGTNENADLVVTRGIAPRYRLDLVFAVCTGPIDALNRIDIDGRVAAGPADWSFIATGPAIPLGGGPATIKINAPQLHGNVLERVAYRPDGAGSSFDFGDGALGRVSASPGAPGDTLITSSPLGYPNVTTGELRGVCSVTLRGLAPGDADDVLKAGGAPFYHGTTPRLRPFRFIVTRTNRRSFDDAQWYAARVRIVESTTAGGTVYGMNPIHVLHELLTDRGHGLGLPLADLDDASFMAAADTLFTEQLAVSLTWDRASQIGDIVKEMERVIDGRLYFDPAVGLWRVRLIRDGDYNPATVPVFDRSNVVELVGYQSPNTDDLPTSVALTYWGRVEQRERIHVVHDQAAIELRGREIRETIKMLSICNVGSANRIVHRELRQLSRSRASVSIMVRPGDAAGLAPGDAFRFTWTEYGTPIDSYFRIGEIDEGTEFDSDVRIDAVEDVFNDRATFYNDPGGSEHQNPSGAAADLTRYVSEVPYWFWRREPFAPSNLQFFAAPELIPAHLGGTWLNRAIVWCPRPYDGADPRWDHSGFVVADSAYDNAALIGTYGFSAPAQLCPDFTITAPVLRNPAVATAIANIVFTSSVWTPRVGDVLRLPCTPSDSSPAITFDPSFGGGVPGAISANNYTFDQNTGTEYELAVVVEVVSPTEVRVARGLWDTTVHETINASTGLVIGWLPVTAPAAGAWFDSVPEAFEGYHGLSAPRSFWPNGLDADGNPTPQTTPKTLLSDIRALATTSSDQQEIPDTSQIVYLLSQETNDSGASALYCSRMSRPLAPAFCSAVDDVGNSWMRVTAQWRNRTGRKLWPASEQRDELVDPGDVTVPEIDPELALKCWVFDGTVSPPEPIRVLSYVLADEGFTYTNAQEQADHLAKHGSSVLFDELWLCIVADDLNQTYDSTFFKALPSWQFVRLHLDRSP